MSDTPHIHFNEDDNTFHEMEQVGPPVNVTSRYEIETGGKKFKVDHNDPALTQLHEAIVDFLSDTDLPAPPPATNMTNLARYFMTSGEVVIRCTITGRRLADGTELPRTASWER